MNTKRSTSSVSRHVSRSFSCAMRPSVRSEVVVEPATREASPIKLSRPQKRRRRLQQLSIHRDRQKQCDATLESADGNTHCLDEDVHTKLDNLESKVSQRLTLLLPTSSAGLVNDGYLFDPLAHHEGMCLFQDGLRASWEPLPARSNICWGADVDQVLSALRPEAPAFIPKAKLTASCSAKLGDFQSMPPDAWELLHAGFGDGSGSRALSDASVVAESCPVLDATLMCTKCSCSVEECYCWDIFCRTCIKTGEDCTCLKPLVRRRSCLQCGIPELDEFSFFNAGASTANHLPSKFICRDCHSNEFTEGELYRVQSAKVCARCRILGYNDLEWCQGKDCALELMLHHSCLNESNGKMLCDDCLHSECEDPGDRSDDQSRDDKGMERPSSRVLWGVPEIQVWVQVTARLANTAFLRCQEEGKSSDTCLEAREIIVRERWNSAVDHVPNSMRQGLFEILMEKPL